MSNARRARRGPNLGVAPAPSNIGLVLATRHHMGEIGRSYLDYGAYRPATAAEVRGSAVGAAASAMAGARFKAATAVGFLLAGGIFGHDRETDGSAQG